MTGDQVRYGRLARAVAAGAATAVLLAAGQIPAGAVGTSVTVLAPPAPTVTAIAGYALRLAWSPVADPDSPTTGYTVYRGAGTDSLAHYADVAATEVGWADPASDATTAYYYAVSATNAGGEGAQSDPVAATARQHGVLVASDKGSTPAPGTDPDLKIAQINADGTQSFVTSDDGDHETPAISPDGSTVVYASNNGHADEYDLWIIRPNALPEHLTTDATTQDAEPSFSPDGTTIAFTRFTDAGESVWTVPTAGGAPHQVAHSAGDTSPAWSPSGRLLALAHYADIDGVPATSIVVTNLDGTYRHAVTGAGGSVVISSTTGAVTVKNASEPSWSPDGRDLAFIRDSTVYTGDPNEDPSPDWSVLYRVPAEGHSPATSLTGADDTYVVTAAWSPLGPIVFSGVYLPGGSQATLWQVPSAGGTPGAVSGAGTDFLVDPAVAEPPSGATRVLPQAVTGLGAVLGSKSATLSWTASTGANWYVVRRSVAGGEAPGTPGEGVAVYAGQALHAVATGLSNGSSYRFTVFAMSAAGDPGPGASRFFQPAAPPGLAPNGTPAAVLAGSGTRFTATWGAALPAGQSYEVQIGTRAYSSATKKWSAPAYKPLAGGRTATGKVVTTTPGATYYLRARVHDSNGNATPWATAVAPVPYDDRAFTKSGVWTSAGSQSGRFAGTLRSSKAADASLTLKQWGSQFALITDRCATCGKIKVYLDGKLVATVDTYASSTAKGRQVWSKTFPAIGQHTVRLVVVGTGARPYAKVDALVAKR